MTRPRHHENRAASIDASTRSDANAAVATGRLLRLFRRTLKDQTPQQRRVLAGDIALEIPTEAVTRGDPEPLWMQHLRTFVRRELDLDPPLPTPGVANASSKPETFDEEITGGGDRLEDASHHVPASPDRKGGRPAISPERARRLLLDAVTRFRRDRDSTEPLTNAGLARATGRNEDTVADRLGRAGWSLEDLDVEWARRARSHASRRPAG